MNAQKHLFNLPADIHYLNSAYMSPLMTTVEEAGIAGIRRKFDPSKIYDVDFFNTAELVKEKFARLINADAAQVAVIPAVSYGMRSVIDNIPAGKGTHAITISDEFPSGYYTINEWCKKNNRELKVIQAPQTFINRGKTWNERILEAINKDTAAVVMSSVHWTDGTRFNLQQIGERCKEMGAYFIVDGTQSTGALPIDVKKYKIDALVCAGYKWLLGPYSIGLAYYDEQFNIGTPVEDAWINKSNARDFTRLTKYVDEYAAGAMKFNVGENGNLILLPMLDRSLEQILEWGAASVQSYSNSLIHPLVDFLQQKNYWIEEEAYRTDHLFGFMLPPGIDRDTVLQKLKDRKIFVSVRGDAIRVSLHVYNTPADITALIETLDS